jgi:hypothetical protein
MASKGHWMDDRKWTAINSAEGGLGKKMFIWNESKNGREM